MLVRHNTALALLRMVRRLSLILCLCSILIQSDCVLLASIVEAAATRLPVASITAVLQSGLLLRLGNIHPTAAAPFTPLFPGDRVRTGRGQRTAILLRDGSQFLLNENTDLGINFPVLHLYHGEIFGRIPHSGVRHAVVQTDAAVAAVEGTQFDISVGLSQNPAHTVLTVVEGSVRLSNALGSVLVQASEQATANPNTAPSQPVVVQVSGIILWTSRVHLVATISLPPHYRTPRAATLAAATAQRTLIGHPHDPAALLMLADARADSGNSASALSIYSQALRFLPAANLVLRARAETGIAAMSFVQGNLGLSNTFARRALAHDPDNLEAGLLRGHINVAQGNLANALLAYQLMRTRHPADPAPLLSIGFVLLLQREDAMAQSTLEAVLRQHPPSWLVANALIDLGELASFHNNLALALTDDLQAVRADPQSPAGWTNAGSVLGEQGRYTEALAPLQTAARLGAPFERAIAHDDLGDVYYQLGRLGPELTAYLQAATLNPTDAVAANGVGSAELALGNNERAITYTRRAVQLAPAISDLRADYARALWAAHQNSLAVIVCHTGLRSDPHSANLYLILGYALEGEGRLDQAHAAYARAYALRPASIQSAEDAALAGQLAFYAGHLSEAIANLQRATVLHPANYQSWQFLALVKEHVHDYRDARMAATQAIQLNSADLISRGIQARADQALGHTTQAIAEYQEIIRLDPTETGTHIQLAIMARSAGDLSLARREMLAEIQVQSEPVNRSAYGATAALALDWAELAMTDDALHQTRQAIAEYQRALSYAPHTPSYYLEIGFDQRLLGQLDQAVTAFTAAITPPNPHTESALYYRAEMEWLLGRLAPAAVDVHQALILNPRDATARQLFGIVLERQGHFAAARSQYVTTAELLKKTPGAAVAWAASGSMSDKLGDYASAIQAYRRSLTINSHNALVHDELAFDLLRTGNYVASRAEFSIVIVQNPHNPFAYLLLALIDDHDGKTNQAIIELKRQMSINSANPTLQAADSRELGIILANHHRWVEAVAAFQQVIALGSPVDQDYLNLGIAEVQAKMTSAALIHLHKAYALALAAHHAPLVKATCTELGKLGAPCPGG